jgi:hypothetical protein
MSDLKRYFVYIISEEVMEDIVGLKMSAKVSREELINKLLKYEWSASVEVPDPWRLDAYLMETACPDCLEHRFQTKVGLDRHRESCELGNLLKRIENEADDDVESREIMNAASRAMSDTIDKMMDGELGKNYDRVDRGCGSFAIVDKPSKNIVSLTVEQARELLAKGHIKDSSILNRLKKMWRHENE